MYTILEESVKGKDLKTFRNFQWRSSNNLPNTLTEAFWCIKTNFRLNTFIKYFKMKAIYGFLSVFEARLLYDAPGVLTDNLFVASLRAKLSDVPLDILTSRIRVLQQLLQEPLMEINLYHTYSGCIKYEIMETRRTIRKVKKYSGYVRNPSSVGSKRKSKTFSILPETFECDFTEGIDFYEFLTVGKFSGNHLEIFFPDDGQIRPKQ